MKKLLRPIGRSIYWLTYPLTSLHLRNRPRARVFLVCEDEVLLTKDFIGDGKWALPGGGLHKNELPSEAAVRELVEETGVAMPAARLTPLFSARYSNRGKSPYEVFWVTVEAKPKVKAGKLEIIDARWHSLKRLRASTVMGEDVMIAHELFIKLPENYRTAGSRA